MRMFRDAAALALVGWYLLMPPWYQGKREPDFNAPLSEWVINQSTANECEDILMSFQGKSQTSDSSIDRRRRASACVPTDDPRLK
jgi:hypothetical protein